MCVVQLYTFNHSQRCCVFYDYPEYWNSNTGSCAW